MNSAALVSELAERLNLPELKLDDHGLARIGIDDKIDIQFEHASDIERLHVFTTLGTIPAEGKEAIYEALLTANPFGHQTGGATLGIEPMTGEILLTLLVNPDTTGVDEFVHLLEAFVAAAETWQDWLASGGGSNEEAKSDAMDPPAGGGIRA